MPPARPSNWDTAGPVIATATPVDSAEPVDAGKLVSLDHPLPPSRPQVFALAAPELAAAASRSDALATGSVPGTKAGPGASSKPAEIANTAGATAAGPDPSGQIVALDHRLPPARPFQFALAAPPPTGAGTADRTVSASGAGAPPIRLSPDKDGLVALFDTSALVPAHRPTAGPIKIANAVVRTALPKVAQEVIARPTSAAGHFSASSAPPIVNRFSGKAVEPLNSLGFATTQ